MGYEQAMEAAGANVLAFERFGSYQGDWWAKVEYEGKTYWVHGYYGSCSGCDAFEAHFGYGDKEHCDEHRYDYSDEPKDCKACAEAAKAYQQELADFGKSYIFGNEYTQEEAEKEASADWHYDDRTDQIKFLKENAIERTGEVVENTDYNLDGL